jgi:hypothetical protein
MSQSLSVLRLLVAACALVLLGRPVEAGAQVIRGTVRTATGLLPIDAARVSVVDSAGTILVTTISDAMGAFQFNIPASLAASRLQARRLGYDVMTLALAKLAPGDTAEFEFLMTTVAAVTEAVTITAEPSLNDRRLLEARRRGWRIYSPERVAMHRERSNDFFQLMRAVGTVGLILPRNLTDCVRATRNNRCLTYVVDNQVLGESAMILPSDIYFFAVLGASESRIQFGDRAPWGAIAIYTRSRTDRPTVRRPD